MVLTTVNVYPLNLVFGSLGGLLWFVVGLQTKDNALAVVEFASAAIYLFGLVMWSLKYVNLY
jgi:hypothetical protein